MVCEKCGATLTDGAKFCDKCGASTGAAANNTAQAAPQAAPQPVPVAAPAVDPFDHTAEYDAKDISENKVIALCPYVFSVLGVIVALLATRESRYVAFHAKQALKIYVCYALATFVNVVPLLGQIAYAVISVLVVIAIIAGFFNVCNGKAKEAMFVRGLGFLK